VVFKRRWLVVVFATMVLAIVTIVALLIPPTFEAQATLLVNTARAEIPIGPKESPQLIASQVTEQDLNSEIELLKSRQLLEEVLQLLDLEEPIEEGAWISAAMVRVKKALGGAQLPFNDRMVLLLQEEIKIEAVRKSNVIRVSYRSKDPETATRIVATLTDRYLDRRAQMYQSPQTLLFFEEQVKGAGPSSRTESRR